MEAHADTDRAVRERRGAFRRRRSRILRRRKGHEERVSLRVDLDAAVGRERLAQRAAMLGQRVRIGSRAEGVQKSPTPPPSAPRSPSEPAKGTERIVRGVLVLVGAAGVGYGVMTMLRSRLDANMTPPVASVRVVPVEKAVPVPSNETIVAPSAAPVASAPAVESVQQGVWPVQELELPPDITVTPDRGLLEIDVAAPHSMFIRT